MTKWFYDVKWGGCNRFWFGGCEPGKNFFDDEKSCQTECVTPRGSGVCFLRKVAGSCDAEYTEWYFDADSRTCKQFFYSGCLGNGNRFRTREGCQEVCQGDRDDIFPSLCQKPKAEGPCQGSLDDKEGFGKIESWENVFFSLEETFAAGSTTSRRAYASPLISQDAWVTTTVSSPRRSARVRAATRPTDARRRSYVR